MISGAVNRKAGCARMNSLLVNYIWEESRQASSNTILDIFLFDLLIVSRHSFCRQHTHILDCLEKQTH